MQALTAQREELVRAVTQDILGRDGEFRHDRRIVPETDLGRPAELAYYRVALEDEPHAPQEVFDRLRWGGRFIYVSRDGDEVDQAAALFPTHGFELSIPHAYFRQGRNLLGMRIPFLGRRLHYFVARKVMLLQPRQISDRFTYNVELVHSPEDGSFEVLKQVPTTERVIARLRHKFPNVPMDVVTKRARKFTEKIFPLFLTREAAMLKILQRRLPPAYAQRVPKLLDLEVDGRGLVRSLRMNWLRNGGKPITQLEFAAQAADLLHALHDMVGVIHLDLRLDNFVITEHGVGFVDFGSSVRVGEDLSGSGLLATLFEELMHTSEIQRMLEKMTLSGAVTSPVIREGYQKVDKAVDFFYLAVQINQPLNNPDFRGLVQFDPASDEAKAIKQMTAEVLRPHDANHPMYRGVKDLLRDIEIYAAERRLPEGLAVHAGDAPASA